MPDALHPSPDGLPRPPSPGTVVTAAAGRQALAVDAVDALFRDAEHALLARRLRGLRDGETLTIRPGQDETVARLRGRLAVMAHRAFGAGNYQTSAGEENASVQRCGRPS